MFTGQFRGKLDKKCRLILPERYWEALREEENEPRSMFFVAGDTATVYSDQGFGRLVLGLYDELRTGAADEKTRMMSHIVAIHAQVKASPQGVTAIPRNFRDIYGFKKDMGIYIVGCGNYFEIWNADTWEHRQF